MRSVAERLPGTGGLGRKRRVRRTDDQHNPSRILAPRAELLPGQTVVPVGGVDVITEGDHMSTTDVRSSDAAGAPRVATFDMKVEVIVIPVADVDRAKEFYLRLGWRLDVTPPTVVQFTPPGSSCSVQFGASLSSAAPGSGKGYLIVSDIVTARDALVSAGADVSEVFHIGPDGPVGGVDPERRSYFSRATFSDPDGNAWLLQEITTRLPGRVDPGRTSFGSASELASAMIRAATAHGEHEQRTGERDENWPAWYAEYMGADQAGTQLPT